MVEPEQSVSPGDINNYIELVTKQKKLADNIIELKQNGLLNEAEIPKKITALMIEMQKNVTKVLKDNQILSDEDSENEWKEKIE